MDLSSRMLLYNITVIVEDDIADKWVTWIKEDFIAPTMLTGIFISKSLLKVMFSPNEGVTYCIQFTAENLEAVQQFKQVHEPALMAALAAQFGNKALSFTSLMEKID